MDDMITITREEYDRLRDAAEDLADIQAYDRAMAEGGESIPEDVVAQVITGDAPVRVFRLWRGMTQLELSKAAGVNRVDVTKIETGKRTGSVETLKRLSAALDVDLELIA